MKLVSPTTVFILSLLLAASAAAETSENVKVSETCERSGCTVTIVGPDNACVNAAKKKRWDDAFEAAVKIRNCLDRVVLAGGAK